MAITTGAGLMTYQTKEVLNKVLNTSNDSLQVDIVDATGVSITATSDSVFVDDAAFTLGSSKGTMIMGFAGTQSVNADDAAALACDTDGALHIADGGNSITIDGTVTADLGSTDNAVLDAMVVDLAAMEVLSIAANVDHAANEALLITIDEDTNAIKGHVDGIETLITSTNSKIDTLETTLTAIETDQAALEVLSTAANVDHAANEALLITIDADTSSIKTAVETIDNAISGSEMQVDVVASLPAGSSTIGVVDLGATDNAVLDAMVVDLAAMEVLLTTIDSDTDAIKTAVQILDDWDDSNYANVNMNIGGSDVAAGNAVPTTHSVTGIVDGLKVVTTAGTDVVLAGSTACKKVDIQAQTDNTSVIAVGATGVDATVATGTGIILNAGDVYSMEIDNLADIYIDSLVDGEGVRFTYFT